MLFIQFVVWGLVCDYVFSVAFIISVDFSFVSTTMCRFSFNYRLFDHCIPHCNAFRSVDTSRWEQNFVAVLHNMVAYSLMRLHSNRVVMVQLLHQFVQFHLEKHRNVVPTLVLSILAKRLSLLAMLFRVEPL